MKPFHQKQPVRVPVPDGKTILEHFGHLATGTSAVSIARMVAPPGWSEPSQSPEFDEYTLMVRGRKKITLPDGPVVIAAGESLFVPAGTRVMYANPFDEPAEYWAVCVPAFSPELANRDQAPFD